MSQADSHSGTSELGTRPGVVRLARVPGFTRDFFQVTQRAAASAVSDHAENEFRHSDISWAMTSTRCRRQTADVFHYRGVLGQIQNSPGLISARAPNRIARRPRRLGLL